LAALERALEAAGLLGVDLVQSLGHLAVLVFGQEFRNGGGVQFTARDPKALRQSIGRLEEVIREGDGGFHTPSIPR